MRMKPFPARSPYMRIEATHVFVCRLWSKRVPLYWSRRWRVSPLDLSPDKCKSEIQIELHNEPLLLLLLLTHTHTLYATKKINNSELFRGRRWIQNRYHILVYRESSIRTSGWGISISANRVNILFILYGGYGVSAIAHIELVYVWMRRGPLCFEAKYCVCLYISTYMPRCGMPQLCV